MARTSKRPRELTVRGHFVGARINDETRHLLEILAQLHHQSFAAIIERALNELRQKAVAQGGAYQPGLGESEAGHEAGFDIARETWAPEEWLRHLKMFLIAPSVVPPVEQAFWRTICDADNPDDYWIPPHAVDLTAEQRARYGRRVLGIAVPRDESIEEDWKAFVARGRPVGDVPAQST